MANYRHVFLVLWTRKMRDTLNKRKTKFFLTCNVQKVIRALAFRSELSWKIWKFISFQNCWYSLIASPISFNLIWGLDIYSLNRTRYIACTRDTPEDIPRCCQGQLPSFTMAAISSPAISRALLPMTSKADKLPLETEPVDRHNNTSWTLKPGHQTFVEPYSTHNRSRLVCPNPCLMCGQLAGWLSACFSSFIPSLL